MKKTVHTLPTEVVEKITPGNPKNPDNVQRVEFILSQVIIVPIKGTGSPDQCWAAILKNVSFKAIQIHNF